MDAAGHVSLPGETASGSVSTIGMPICALGVSGVSSTSVPTTVTVSVRVCGSMSDRGRPGGGGITLVEEVPVVHFRETVCDTGSVVRGARSVA